MRRQPGPRSAAHERSGRGAPPGGNVLQFRIRRMTSADIPAGMRLKQAAGWNQTFADWQRFLALEPAGSFVATIAGQVAGTVTTVTFQSVGWIGMMLVDPIHRRQGIATRLMQQALHRLDELCCSCVRLDATDMGAAVYGPLGFQGEQEIVRVGGTPRGSLRVNRAVRVRGFQWRDWPSLLELDQLTAGADRTKLLKRLILERPGAARVVSQEGRLCGFSLDRAGSYATLIGPFVALDRDAGRALLADAVARQRNTPVLLDVPTLNHEALAATREAGLSVRRQFLRMARGTPCVAPSPHLWAGSGPEKG